MNADQASDNYFRMFPAAKSEEFWSGCNYYVNRGNHPDEPKGTATSMHECTFCDDIHRCEVKQKQPIWEYSDEIGEDINFKIKLMRCSPRNVGEV